MPSSSCLAWDNELEFQGFSITWLCVHNQVKKKVTLRYRARHLFHHVSSATFSPRAKDHPSPQYLVEVGSPVHSIQD